MHACPRILTVSFILAAGMAIASHQATGVKVGEVTDSSAVIWMRHTASDSRVKDGRPLPRPKKGSGRGVLPPADFNVAELEGAVPGAPGRVRVRFKSQPEDSRRVANPSHNSDEDLSNAQSTEWVEVTSATDFTHAFRLASLKPDTRYHYSAETSGPNGEPETPLRGEFRTAPLPDRYRDVTFTVITGMMFKDLDDREKGFRIYESMQRLEPHFIVPTGDTVYYDNDDLLANTAELARHHWHRMYSLPRLIEFHRRVPGYWIKDDHDTLDNDCWPGRNPKSMLPMTFERGQRIFLEQVPIGGERQDAKSEKQAGRGKREVIEISSSTVVPRSGPTGREGQRTYRTFRWGKGLQIWLVEGRDFRSPNNAPDGPDKTIWGAEQKRWLKDSVLASDADWKVLISPTPLVGPDRGNKSDNHANKAFAHEGNEIRRWIADTAKSINAGHGLFVCCGDRHWQYHSVDPATAVHEFSCGPASDKHAAGSPGLDPQYHRFHKVQGGFLSVAVSGKDEKSRIEFRHHAVDGDVAYGFTARP